MHPSDSRKANRAREFLVVAAAVVGRFCFIEYTCMGWKSHLEAVVRVQVFSQKCSVPGGNCAFHFQFESQELLVSFESPFLIMFFPEGIGWYGCLELNTHTMELLQN